MILNTLVAEREIESKYLKSLVRELREEAITLQGGMVALKKSIEGKVTDVTLKCREIGDEQAADNLATKEKLALVAEKSKQIQSNIIDLYKEHVSLRKFFTDNSHSIMSLMEASRRVAEEEKNRVFLQAQQLRFEAKKEREQVEAMWAQVLAEEKTAKQKALCALQGEINDRRALDDKSTFLTNQNSKEKWEWENERCSLLGRLDIKTHELEQARKAHTRQVNELTAMKSDLGVILESQADQIKELKDQAKQLVSQEKDIQGELHSERLKSVQVRAELENMRSNYQGLLSSASEREKILFSAKVDLEKRVDQLKICQFEEIKLYRGEMDSLFSKLSLTRMECDEKSEGFQQQLTVMQKENEATLQALEEKHQQKKEELKRSINKESDVMLRHKQAVRDLEQRLLYSKSSHLEVISEMEYDYEQEKKKADEREQNLKREVALLQKAMEQTVENSNKGLHRLQTDYDIEKQHLREQLTSMHNVEVCAIEDKAHEEFHQLKLIHNAEVQLFKQEVSILEEFKKKLQEQENTEREYLEKQLKSKEENLDNAMAIKEEQASEILGNNGEITYLKEIVSIVGVFC